MLKYVIESQRPLDLLQLLDAVGALLESGRHKPSTDTLMFGMRGGDIRNVHHSLMGLSITDETDS